MTRGGWQSWLQQPRNWVWLGFLSVAAFFIVLEHRAHLALIIAVALLAACILMNRYMHRETSADPGPEAKGEQP